MALALFNGLRGVGARVPAALGGACQPDAGATPRPSAPAAVAASGTTAPQPPGAAAAASAHGAARLALPCCQRRAPWRACCARRWLRGALALTCARPCPRSCAAAAHAASRRGAASRHADARRRQVHRGRQLEVRAPAVDMLQWSRVSAALRRSSAAAKPHAAVGRRARASSCERQAHLRDRAPAGRARRQLRRGARGWGLSLGALNCRAPAWR